MADEASNGPAQSSGSSYSEHGPSRLLSGASTLDDSGFDTIFLSDSDTEALPNAKFAKALGDSDFDDFSLLQNHDGTPSQTQSQHESDLSQESLQPWILPQSSNDLDAFASLDATSDDVLDDLFQGGGALVLQDDVEQDGILDKDDHDESGEDSDAEGLGTRSQVVEDLETMILLVFKQLCKATMSQDDSDMDEEPHRNRRRGESKKSSGKRIEMRLVDRKKSSIDGIMPTRAIRFPLRGKAASSQTLAQLLRVIEITHEALVNDVPVTKRDMYYQDVALFRSQKVVDALVDDLAATVGRGRAALNVRASSKGLICGSSLSIELTGGEVLAINDSEGFLIPVAEDIARFNVNPNICWVLIVEKDAVFQTLCRLRFPSHPRLAGPGLVVTGKGYPDLATRELIKTFSDNLPETVPLLILVDGDAYGLDIVSVYKNGSQALRHESSRLAAGRVHCIGLWSSEVMDLGIDRDMLLPISAADEKKARQMLLRPDHILPLRWKKELQNMLFTRRKAEIEILSHAHSAKSWVDGSETLDGGSEHPLSQFLIPRVNGAIDELSQLDVLMDSD